MKSIVIAPAGDNMEALYVGIREFPTEKIILITSEDRLDEAYKAKEDLDKFRIPVEIIKIKGNIWEEMFKTISNLKRANEGKNIVINVATGDRATRCAATSAAFVNGVKAFAVDGDSVSLLPVLKFNYYKLLTERKMNILKFLFSEEKCCSCLEELSKKTKMSLPLISYHINGNPKSEGLKNMGLVETKEEKGKVRIELSMLGRLLIKGYVES